MAYSLIAHTNVASVGGADITTAAINTTGADFIVMCTIGFQPNPMTISDSKGNSWAELTAKDDGAGVSLRIIYSRPTTVGSGHTFSAVKDGADPFPSMCVSAWSGSVASPFDQQNGASPGSGTSAQSGSITPTETNELVIAALGLEATNTTPSIDGGFTVVEHVPLSGGNAYGSSLAYLIQTSATAANPTWSWSSAGVSLAVIASFKDTPGGGGGKATKNIHTQRLGMNLGMRYGLVK